ncbi:hypothetical protein AgCh_011958 [Apium graveolens]
MAISPENQTLGLRARAELGLESLGRSRRYWCKERNQTIHELSELGSPDSALSGEFLSRLGVTIILGHMGIHSSSRTNHGIMIGAIILWVFLAVSAVNCIGAKWGTQATHPLELSTTVKLLKDNGFQKVKLFDADSITLTALKGSGL